MSRLPRGAVNSIGRIHSAAVTTIQRVPSPPASASRRPNHQAVHNAARPAIQSRRISTPFGPRRMVTTLTFDRM
jgi:hypothetical protein